MQLAYSMPHWQVGFLKTIKMWQELFWLGLEKKSQLIVGKQINPTKIENQNITPPQKKTKN